jgi:prolyl-tRNA editing enzyme YbaK/EbsC (Cys-tRNA(Pro) deacylase)
MSIEAVRQYLAQWSRDKDIIVMEESTATVILAAAALGVIPARIAKSISLKVEKNSLPGAIVVVTAGDMKLDNRKYKDHFALKAKMLTPDEALEYTGHAVGGVCPFALPPGVDVYLDISLRRFQTVYPACGSGNSAIELTMDELKKYSASLDWIDVCTPIGS